ncbi:MAG: glycosyltransferase family 2 protein [Pseudomonadota bacterium]
MQPSRQYCLISPVRNEAKFIRRTLDSVLSQSVKPAKWVIVDDGSTDETPEILQEYSQQYPIISIVQRKNRGFRKVGAGVIEAFNEGYATIDPNKFDYICKLDVDLDLPPRYFEILMERMEAEERLGTCSGKAYYPGSDNAEGSFTGTLISERCGDETSLGMTKFYRTKCFEDIGGFVSQVMWDGIDCHTCRMKGWIACSWDDPELRFVHLRPMGSSEKGVFTGRKRHGFGQYFMGTIIPYIFLSAAYRALQKPYVVGGLGILVGYFQSMLKGAERYDNSEFRRFIARYQWMVLRQGKAAAVETLNNEAEDNWHARKS